MTEATQHSAVTVLRHGDNPFGVDPSADLLHAVPTDLPGWSETMYFHVWSPVDGVGVFIHISRWPEDLDLWCAQVIALLPDGELLVDRSWGRATDELGPATGNLTIRCTEPLRRWHLSFDGAGERTTVRHLAERPAGGGRPVPFRFDVDLDALSAVWDLDAALGIDSLSWAGVHHVQGLRSTGSLVAGGREWNLAGVAHRDHSSGPRDVTQLGGLHFFAWAFPESGRFINGLVNWRLDGTVDHRTFAIYQADTFEIGADVRVTGLTDPATLSPRELQVSLSPEGGDPLQFVAEVRHGYVLTILNPNVNINGVPHDEEDDPLVITQSTVQVVASDGEVGYGVIERDYRRSMLPSPETR